VDENTEKRTHILLCQFQGILSAIIIVSFLFIVKKDGGGKTE